MKKIYFIALIVLNISLFANNLFPINFKIGTTLKNYKDINLSNNNLIFYKNNTDSTTIYGTEEKNTIYKIEFKKNVKTEQKCFEELISYENLIRKEYDINSKKILKFTRWRNYKSDSLYENHTRFTFGCKLEKKFTQLYVRIENNNLAGIEKINSLKMKSIIEFDKELNQISKNDLFSIKYNGAAGIMFGDFLPNGESITPEINFGSIKVKLGVEKIIEPKNPISFFDIYSVQPKYRGSTIYRIKLKKIFHNYHKIKHHSLHEAILNRSDFSDISKEECLMYKEKLTNLFKDKFDLTPIYYGIRTIFDTEYKRTVLMCVIDKGDYHEYNSKYAYYLLLYSTDKEIFKNKIEKNKIEKNNFNSYQGDRYAN